MNKYNSIEELKHTAESMGYKVYSFPCSKKFEQFLGTMNHQYYIQEYEGHTQTIHIILQNDGDLHTLSTFYGEWICINTPK
jgi:ribosomal protein S8